MNKLRYLIRNLWKGGIYSFINLFGLTLGISACLLISTVVFDSLSYDTHWSRADELFRLISVDKGEGGLDSRNGAAYGGLAPALKTNFDEVEEYGELYVSPTNFRPDPASQESFEIDVLYADSAVTGLLDIHFIEHENLLPEKGIKKIIISERIRDKYFAGQSVLGKRISDVPQYEASADNFVIAGVMKNLPSNTHLRAEAILLKKRTEMALEKDGWGIYVRHYLLLKPGTDAKQFQTKINNWYRQYVGKEKTTQFELQSIKDAYLKTDFGAYQVNRGNPQHLYIFSGVAALLLLIACINFINLSTARANSRLKETGVRKVLGASRKRLILDLLSESALVFVSATAISVLLYDLWRPAVEKFIEQPVQVRLTTDWRYTAALLTALSSTCLLSGLYPAWLISGFKASEGLMGLLRSGGSKRDWLRKTLVTVQFSISVIILIALIVVKQQVHFLKSKDLGFDTTGLISIENTSFEQVEAFRTELRKNPQIQSVSLSSWSPGYGSAGYMSRLVDDPNDPSKKRSLWYIAGETNLAQTLGLRLQSGRLLNPDLSSDAVEATAEQDASDIPKPALISRSTARFFGIDTLNKPIQQAKITPVGIIEDFNSESLREEHSNMIITAYHDPRYGSILIRVIPGTEVKAIQYITQLWKKIYPDKLLNVQPVQEIIEAQYQAEMKLERLFGLFSVLTILLASLGIFGIVIHAARLRTKEIGIRKVLGATVPNIVAMLSKDTVKLVFVAILLASPIAWWAMTRWLEDFAFHTEIRWWVFLISGALAVSVALLTVCSHALKAARANPVDSLRDE